jgi:hypothetical protein
MTVFFLMFFFSARPLARSSLRHAVRPTSDTPHPSLARRTHPPRHTTPTTHAHDHAPRTLDEATRDSRFCHHLATIYDTMPSKDHTRSEAATRATAAPAPPPTHGTHAPSHPCHHATCHMPPIHPANTPSNTPTLQATLAPTIPWLG